MTKKLIIKISAIILTIVLAVVGIIVVFLSLNRNNPVCSLGAQFIERKCTEDSE